MRVQPGDLQMHNDSRSIDPAMFEEEVVKSGSPAQQKRSVEVKLHVDIDKSAQSMQVNEGRSPGINFSSLERIHGDNQSFGALKLDSMNSKSVSNSSESD